MERLQSAIELAVKWHAGQYRKEHKTAGYKIPFIVHPMQVMKVVFDWGAGTEENLAAAATHDILEDTDITNDELLAEIGVRSTQIVQELTFYEQVEDPTARPEQKHKYLQTFATKSVNALVIKLADRACNVQDFINGGDGAYGAKYARKAEPLYEAVMSRTTEIEQAYGRPTTLLMVGVVKELLIAAMRG